MHKIHDAYLTFKGIYRYQTFLKKSRFFSEEEQLILQSKWLSNLFLHAQKNIPWYSSVFRDVGLNIYSSNPIEELKKLPILTKKDVQNNHGSFCVPGAADRSIKFSTSGTTGEPMTAYTSFNQWELEQGLIWRQWKDAGYNFRDRMGIFRSYAPEGNQPQIKLDRLRNWSYFSVFDMNDADIHRYADYLTKWKPSFLRGYPSALNLVAEHALRFGWQVPSLRAAFTASEVVPDSLRKNLLAAFNIELFDHYGQAEITSMFHECEKHDGMHVNWEYGLVELLPSDEKGIYRIIATNLHNSSMPLLRYDTGDLAVGFWRNCDCGRSSLKITSIRGRQDDYLLMSDGSKSSLVNLYTYFSDISDIKRFQLIQDRPGELIVMIDFSEFLSEKKLDDFRLTLVNDLKTKTKLLIKCPKSPKFIQSTEGKFSAFVQRGKSVI
ncbi:hypothetical protein OAK96_06510 [Pseudomonadota bacterium]|nr:hypothetical protein [Pseudomonadota bacterium]